MRSGTLLASICLVLGAAGFAAAWSVTGRKPLHMVERGGGIRVVDNPPKARHPYDFSAGDIVVVSRDLYSVSGARTGTLRLVCVATTPTAQHCSGSAQLSKGTIEFAGDAGPTPVTTVAVVGGTGAYAGARGTSTSTDRKSAGAVADEVIRFTR